MSDDDDRLDLSAWTAPPPPAGLTDRALDRLDGRASAHALPDLPPRRRWRWAIAGAALAAAALGGAIVASRAPTRGAGAGGVTATAATAVELADGVEALIEAGATITWTTDGEVVRIAHLAGVVTYRQRGARRLAITTPAATLSSARATFRVEAPMNRTLIAGAAVGLAGVVAIIVYDGSVEAKRPAGDAETLRPGGETRLAIAPTPTDRPDRPRPTAVVAAAVDRARRAEVAQAIAAARARPAGAAPLGSAGAAVVGTAPPVDDATPGELTKDEIRAGVREVIPLITECYELELAKDPTAREATVKARFTIDSAADVGTVVTVGDLAIDGRLGASTEFRDCMTATLEAVVLPPLGDGGTIEVNYPFVFRASDDDEGEPPTPAAAAPPDAPRPTPAGSRATAPQKPADGAAKPTAGATTADLTSAATEAALNAQWGRALELAQAGLAAGGSAADRSKLVNIGALAACRIRRYDEARALYRLAKPAQQRVIEQACLQASDGAFTPAQ